MSKFNLNTLKGRLAEHMVQDLFIQSGYNVFNFGLERLHPFLSKALSSNYKRTGKELRFMPDFVVQSTHDGSLFYLEVKYRSSGQFYFNEKYSDYPYQNAWFVIVSPRKIQALHYNRLVAGEGISPKSNYNLLGVKAFHISPELLAEYEAYARQMFAPFENGDKAKQQP